MKKMKFRAVALVAAVIMALSFASCSINITADSSSESPTEETIPEINSIMDIYEYLKTEDEKYQSMQEFVEADVFGGFIESLDSVITEQGLSIGIGAEGDSLVYEYRFDEQVEVTDELKDEIAAQVESISDVTESNLETIKDYVDIENPSIEYVYLNADGTEIYSRTFTLAG